jgi:hypothetical protein
MPSSFAQEASGSPLQKAAFSFGWAGLHNEVPVSLLADLHGLQDQTPLPRYIRLGGIAEGVTRGRGQDDLCRHTVLNWSERRAECPAES